MVTAGKYHTSGETSNTAFPFSSVPALKKAMLNTAYSIVSLVPPVQRALAQLPSQVIYGTFPGLAALPSHERFDDEGVRSKRESVVVGSMNYGSLDAFWTVYKNVSRRAAAKSMREPDI
ncbi:MAG: hypothetical protein Q9168_005628 [Polycauliona sp. 1 TL-2023]